MVMTVMPVAVEAVRTDTATGAGMTIHIVAAVDSASVESAAEIASPVGAGVVTVTSDVPAIAVACRTEVAAGAGITA